MRRSFLAAPLLALTPFLALQDPGRARERGPEVGAPAPRFRLNDHSGRAVRVGGKSRTWTVVAFYPKAATPG